MIAADRSEATAATIARRAADLLGAQVSVVDQRGRVISTSRGGPQPILHSSWIDPGSVYLEVPLDLEGMQGSTVVVTNPAEGEAVPPRLARALIELVANQTTVLQRLPSHDELKSKFIQDLVNGSVEDEERIEREAQVLGIDLSRPRSVILADVSGYILRGNDSVAGPEREARIRRRAQLVIGSIVRFFMLTDDTICAYIGNGEIIILKACGSSDLRPWISVDDSCETEESWANLRALKRAAEALRARLETDTRSAITVGVGRHYRGLQGLAVSYRDARAALTLGRRFECANRVHSLDSLGVATFIGVNDDDLRRDLAGHLLRPIEPHRELIETLECFFDEGCSPSAASRRLMLHRNTLGYRLQKVSALTGLDPRRFDDAVHLRLALAIRRLHEDWPWDRDSSEEVPARERA